MTTETGRKTQKVMVLAFLKAGAKLSPRKAIDLFLCFRLAAVICELRKDGHNIKTTIRFKNKISKWDGLPMQINYAEYTLPADEE